MKEALVQWTLLNNKTELAEYLKFDIFKVVGQEISTDFGRLDFVLVNNKKHCLVVELETILDSKYKREYCFKQTLEYKNVKFGEHTDYCIFYAEETSKENQTNVDIFCKDKGIIARKYSLDTIRKLYSQTVERLSLNFGLALPTPKNYTICYLRWLNKIMNTFLVLQKDTLMYEEIIEPFIATSGSRTNFNCYERIASDFELITKQNSQYNLTFEGKLFVSNINPSTNNYLNTASVELTNEQKRILLKILTNGNWENKIHKVNIYWFLRFIEVTQGT